MRRRWYKIARLGEVVEFAKRENIPPVCFHCGRRIFIDNVGGIVWYKGKHHLVCRFCIRMISKHFIELYVDPRSLARRVEKQIREKWSS